MNFRLFFIFAGLVTATLAGQNAIRPKRQTTGTGFTFAIPGLNLLQGGLGGNNNLFGQKTFTRTLISTVSTVTTASFRTCTTSAAGLMPCAGRRRRDIEGDNENDIQIEASPAIALIVGTTTISNPDAVSQYLEDHKPSSQSIIYPPDYIPPVEMSMGNDAATTLLYPSDDTPPHDHIHEDLIPFETTELPATNDDADLVEDEVSTIPSSNLNEEEDPSSSSSINDPKARAGLLGTTTTTTVIRVTSVATTIASGAMATLTVSYLGCIPPSLPITTNVCAP